MKLNFVIMNSEGKFYSRAGTLADWSTENLASVYPTREAAEADARFINHYRADFGLPNGTITKEKLSPLFIEETELPVTD